MRDPPKVEGLFLRMARQNLARETSQKIWGKIHKSEYNILNVVNIIKIVVEQCRFR